MSKIYKFLIHLFTSWGWITFIHISGRKIQAECWELTKYEPYLGKSNSILLQTQHRAAYKEK